MLGQQDRAKLFQGLITINGHLGFLLCILQSHCWTVSGVCFGILYFFNKKKKVI